MQHLDEGLLQAWLDRERSGLTAAELAEIERHLSMCETCARKLEALDDSSRRVDALLAPAGDASESMPAYAEIRTRAGASGRARRRSPWTAVGWAASVAVALGAGWMANEMYREGRLPPSVAESLESLESAERAVPGTAASAPAGASGVEPARDAEAARPSAPSPSARADAGAAAPAPPPERVADGVPSRPADVAPSRPADVAPSRPADAAAESIAIAATTFEEEPSVTVRGRVTDEAGRPLESAQVVVQGVGVGTLTRADGTFKLSLDQRPGSFLGDVTLTADLIGYDRESRPLTLLGGDSALADFRLGARSLSLQELVVTGEQAPAAEAATDVPRDARREDATYVVWRAVSRAAAEAAAGFRVLTLPQRPVLGVKVASVGDATFVRIVQLLAGESTVELVESHGPIPPALAVVGEGQARVTQRRGSLYVSATAPVSREALEELLKSLR